MTHNPYVMFFIDSTLLLVAVLPWWSIRTKAWWWAGCMTVRGHNTPSRAPSITICLRLIWREKGNYISILSNQHQHTHTTHILSYHIIPTPLITTWREKGNHNDFKIPIQTHPIIWLFQDPFYVVISTHLTTHVYINHVQVVSVGPETQCDRGYWGR